MAILPLTSLQAGIKATQLTLLMERAHIFCNLMFVLSVLLLQVLAIEHPCFVHEIVLFALRLFNFLVECSIFLLVV